MRSLIFVALAVLLFGCSQEQTATTPYRPTLAMMDTMDKILDPAADVIWGSSGWDITAEGEKELWPTTEEGWERLIYASAVISESGNLMMMPGRVEGADNRGEDWIAYSDALIDIGNALIKASEERNKQAIFDLGGDLYRVCIACHTRYAYPDNE